MSTDLPIVTFTKHAARGASDWTARNPARRRFLTAYTQGGARFGSWIWAKTFTEARRIARRRGLGETVDGVIAERMTREAYRGLDTLNASCSKVLRSTLPEMDKVHALTFLTWLALRTEAATADELVGDDGLLHGWIHLALEAPTATRAELLRRVVAVEKAIPGYCRPPNLEVIR